MSKQGWPLSVAETSSEARAAANSIVVDLCGVGEMCKARLASGMRL